MGQKTLKYTFVKVQYRAHVLNKLTGAVQFSLHQLLLLLLLQCGKVNDTSYEVFFY